MKTQTLKCAILWLAVVIAGCAENLKTTADGGVEDRSCNAEKLCGALEECIKGKCEPADATLCERDSECPEGSECPGGACQTRGTRKLFSEPVCDEAAADEGGEGCPCESDMCRSDLVCEKGRCARETELLPPPFGSPCMIANSSLSEPICVWQVEITDKHDPLLEAPELEVFLRDEFQRVIGCAGETQGLLEVDTVRLRYRVNAHFIRPDGQPLRFKDLPEGELFLDAAENDDDPCKSSFAPGPSDQTLGQSSAFQAEDLTRGVSLSFGDVEEIRFGIGPRWTR